MLDNVDNVGNVFAVLFRSSYPTHVRSLLICCSIWLWPVEKVDEPNQMKNGFYPTEREKSNHPSQLEMVNPNRKRPRYCNEQMQNPELKK